MRKLVFFVGLILLTCSCNSSNRFAIDTSENRVEVKIKRFDLDLLGLDTTKTDSAVQKLYDNYPEFLPMYVTEVLDTSYENKAVVASLFRQYLTDKSFTEINQRTVKTFQDVSGIESEISDAFTTIHYYFPDAQLPEIYFYVSGFNRAVMMNQNFIAFGTDYYLGRDFAPYKDFTYQYLIYNMHPDCLPVDVVSTTLFRLFSMDGLQDRLLDNMLFRGKVMYLLSVCMPSRTTEQLMGYTPEQQKWSETYEKEIWAEIIDKKALFSTDMLLIRKFLNDAPFTAPISQESPGRLGTWIGMQIVKSYMESNTELSLRDLMQERDYQKILEKSNYRP